MDPAQATDLLTYGTITTKSLLTLVPGGAQLVYVMDQVQSDVKFAEIFARLQALEKQIQDAPERAHDEDLRTVLGILLESGLATKEKLRMPEACLVLIRQLNVNSESGQSNDPLLDSHTCLELLGKNLAGDNPEKDLMLTVHELERFKLIYNHTGHRIGPQEYFFCRTDQLFQNWDPARDARTIIEFLTKNDQDQASLEKLNELFDGNVRRVNSAVAFMHARALIARHQRLGGITYVLPWILLAREAYFFIR